MNLHIPRRTNIRHFAYYLVNGTLDFEALNSMFEDRYQATLIANPQVFEKICQIFMLQEVRDEPSWPQVKILAQHLISEINGQCSITNGEIADAVNALDAGKQVIFTEFQTFVHWLVSSPIVSGIGYKNYLADGATFVEQCFAIWSNVIEFDTVSCKNRDETLNKVSEWIKFYYGQLNDLTLSESEMELH